MMIVDIFAGIDDREDMLQSLVDEGLIGVFGGRVEVRGVIADVAAQASGQSESEDYISSAFNHPHTELGYVWDTNRYSLSQAKEIVIKLYDKKYGHLF